MHIILSWAKMIPDKLALLVGPVHTRSAAFFFFFFRGQPHQTISPEEVTVHVNMTDRCTIKAAMVMCKSAACRAAAEHSLEAFLWSDILQTKQLLQGSYWRTKLPLLINCPSAHTWCRTKQESDCWRACSVKTTVHYWTGFVLPPCYWPPVSQITEG